MQNCSWAVADGCSSGWVLAAVQDHSLFVSYVSSLNFLRDLNLRCFVDIPVKLPVDIHHYPRESDKIGKKLWVNIIQVSFMHHFHRGYI